MIHISLEGIIKTSEEEQQVIQSVSQVCETEGYPFTYEKQHGEIYLCPCGIIEVSADHYYFTAKTNSALAGAGFHVAAVELFEKIQAACPVYLSIDDECEYIDDHDFERIYKNYFIPYMSALMSKFGQMQDEDEATYAWDNKSFLPVAKEKSVITPLGYIHASDCRGLSVEEACNLYYVWNKQSKDAGFYRSCALVSLWCDCLFESSAVDEAARNVAASICLSLEKAHELDSELALPIDEYQQLCRILNRKNKIFNVDQYPKKNVGYRKEKVFYVYGNWFVYFDGMAIQSFDGHTMILELKNDEETLLSMRITGYKNTEKMDFAYRYLNSVNALDSIDFENEGIRVKGVLHELKDESHLLYLQVQCIKDNEMLMINTECADMEMVHQAIVAIENIQMIPHERGEVNVAV